MNKHALLSASSSHRWLNCPPSAALCAAEDNTASEYAKQGTDAHELCQYKVEQALGRDVKDPTAALTYFDAEMCPVQHAGVTRIHSTTPSRKYAGVAELADAQD